MVEKVPPVHEDHLVVHHYTSGAGLQGILETQTLFATHYRYLNDWMEIRQAQAALVGYLQHQVKAIIREDYTGTPRQIRHLQKGGGIHLFAYKQANEIVKMLYDITFGGGEVETPFASTFITSFCSHSGDEDKYERENGLLSQWRSYAENRENGGFAIVFDSKKLWDLLDREAKIYYVSAMSFGDVIYDGDVEGFEREFADLPLAMRKVVDRKLYGGPPEYDEVFNFFVSCVTRFKHRAFREEREVRVIASHSTPEILEYLKRYNPNFDLPDLAFKEVFHRPGTEIPTVRLFDYTKDDKLPVVQVIVGPHRNQNENADFAKKLVQRLDLRVPIRLSETPYLGG